MRWVMVMSWCNCSHCSVCMSLRCNDDDDDDDDDDDNDDDDDDDDVRLDESLTHIVNVIDIANGANI